MSVTCWNAPNLKYNTLEKQKLNSTLDLITTEKMYGNQTLYLKAVIFQAKTITSTHMQLWYWLSRYAASTSTREKLRTKLIINFACFYMKRSNKNLYKKLFFLFKKTWSPDQILSLVTTIMLPRLISKAAAK